MKHHRPSPAGAADTVAPRTLTCRELVEFLDAYRDCALPVPTREAFEAHLGECPECVAYVRAYEQAIHLTRDALCGDDAVVPDEVPDELVEAIVAARVRR